MPHPVLDTNAEAEKINVTNLVNTGDPAVLNQAANTIAALASFSQGSNETATEKGELT